MQGWIIANFEQIASGILVVALPVLAALGIINGKRRREREDAPDSLAIAGAVIDNRKADELIASIGKLGDVLVKVEGEIAGNTKAIVENSRIGLKLHRDIEELRRETRDLTLQMVAHKR